MATDGSTTPATPHRWNGWPGAYCLDCGCDEPGEAALALSYDPYSQTWGDPADEARWRTANASGLAPCPEPNSKRCDPYAKR